MNKATGAGKAGKPTDEEEEQAAIAAEEKAREDAKNTRKTVATEIEEARIGALARHSGWLLHPFCFDAGVVDDIPLCPEWTKSSSLPGIDQIDRKMAADSQKVQNFVPGL